MSMKLEWSIDSVADGIDVVGALEISDDSGNKIEVDYTYLDSWFEAILAALPKLRSHSHLELEVVEEPDPLMLDMRDGGLHIL